MSLNGNIENKEVIRGSIVTVPLIDNTLSKKGQGADAEATGNALKNKVSFNDIVDNLTTNDAKKPLSANQGLELKKQIDKAQSDIDEVSGKCADVQSDIESINDRFKLGGYSSTTQQFTLPVKKSALVIMSTSGNSDLFIVSNYDENNKKVTRLSNNMSTFSVTISGNTVSVKNENYWYKYNAVII